MIYLEEQTILTNNFRQKTLKFIMFTNPLKGSMEIECVVGRKDVSCRCEINIPAIEF